VPKPHEMIAATVQQFGMYRLSLKRMAVIAFRCAKSGAHLILCGQ
jgi:hypothetical protein